MNATSRYILTATAVGAGLFTLGATANALASAPGPGTHAIGNPVVLPSSDPLPNPSTSTPVEVSIPAAQDLDDPNGTSSTPTTGTGWATTPSTGTRGDDSGAAEIESGGGGDD